MPSPNPLAYLGPDQASETVIGVSRLATQAETVAGISREIATTPYGVAGLIAAGAPAASTTVAGILKTTTNGDAVAGILSNTAIVPSNLADVFASPPAIGGTAPAAGTFTTLTATTLVFASALDVSEGGTGLSTITDHGVMLGSGTGAVTPTAVGATNQLFIGQTGADPIWSNNIDVPGTLDVTGAAVLDSTLNVVGTLTGAAVTASGLITGTAGITVTGAAINLGSDAGAFAVNLGTGAAAKTITIGNSTGATSIALNAGTGAINIGTNAIAHTVTIGNITGATAVAVNSGTGGIALVSTGTGDITAASADTLLLDSAGVLELNSSAGVISIGNDAVAQNINIGTGAAARVVTIGNVTGASRVLLNSGTAGIALASTGAGDITIASSDTVLIDSAGVLELNSSAGVIGIGNDAVAQNINIGTGAAARTITVGNVSGATALALNAGTGGIALASTGAGDITLASSDTVLIDSAGVLELNSSAGIISIGNDAVAQNINIGTGAAARTVTIGNGSGATAVTINSGTAGVNVGTNAIAQTVTIGNTTGASAVVLTAGSGKVSCATSFLLSSVATQFQMNGGAVTDFIGQAVLVGGTKTVANTNIAAADRIFLSRSTLGGTAGHLSFVINPGADFVITSSTALDTSTIDYVIIRQN